MFQQHAVRFIISPWRLHQISFPFNSPWTTLMLPWPIKWHTYVLFILGDPATPNSTSMDSPLLICGLQDFFTGQKPLQPYKASAWSPSSLQLVSSCGVGKPTVGSYLTGWRAAQIAILSWIVPVHPGASLVRVAWWKASFPIRIGPRIQLWHSFRWMAYYSRYATKRKDFVLGALLLWLVMPEH
jgi:hypothetical protein